MGRLGGAALAALAALAGTRGGAGARYEPRGSVGAGGGGSSPPLPEWPEAFEVGIHETNLFFFSTGGRYWYDASLQAERIDRDSGLGDRYCGTAHPLSRAPCSHVVTGGVRYLRFPDKGECCRCCDADHGCGFLRQDWLAESTFQGSTSEGGENAYKWEVNGLQSNYVWTAVADGRPLRVLQAPNDDMVLQPDFSPGSVDPAVFDVSDCRGECGGICARLRGGGTSPA